MDADWDEVSSVVFPGQTLASPSPRQTSTVAFDTGEELIWAGCAVSRVRSFFLQQLPQQVLLQPYTSWKFQPKPFEGPIRQFLFNEKGVIVLGTCSVQHAHRRGAQNWCISPNVNLDVPLKGLRCMSFTSKTSSEILVAGEQDTMLVIDVTKGRVTQQLPAPNRYTIMKFSRRWNVICAATNTGTVDFLDESLKVFRSWKAHASFIKDMDVQGDFVATTGGSIKPHVGPQLDTFVNVFDLRNKASVQPVAFPPKAAYVRLHPKMVTTAIVMSMDAEMRVVDLVNPTGNQTKAFPLSAPQPTHLSTPQTHLSTPSTELAWFEIAPSGEALVLADSNCEIHLWASPTKLRYNDIVVHPRMPNPVAPPPQMDWSPDTPLSSVGLPFYDQPLFSRWPVWKEDIRCPPPNHRDLIASLKKTEIGYYGPNTRGGLRNQYENTTATSRPSDGLQPPKFLSERAREFVTSPGLGSSVESTVDPGAGSSSRTVPQSLKPDVAPMYTNFEIRYSKFGVSDFDFGHYNKTRYPGLENHITNSYANSLLQLLHYTPLLRNLALQHTATSCLVESCLLCELGFVFDMLQKAEDGSPCKATNMLKALSNSSVASQRRLIEDDNVAGRPLTDMVQDLCRFLFERTKEDYASIPPASTALEQSLFTFPEPAPSPSELLSKVLTISAVKNLECQYETCKDVISKDEPALVTELVYPPPKSTVRGSQPTRTQFSHVLRQSVVQEKTVKGWCKRCQRYRSLKISQKISSAPAVLALTVGATKTPDVVGTWATPGWIPDEIGIIIADNQFFCYEGEDLKYHLERRNHNVMVYSLVGVVVNIEGGLPQKPHLAAVINVAHSEPVPPNESKWHLFNDFSVRPVSREEALTFNTTWKTPSVIMYHLKEANNKSSMEWQTNLDTSVLFKDSSPASDHKTYQILDPETEQPSPKTIVALDTEFVSLRREEIQLNADGERETIRPMWHALARVSVIRGQGEHEGLPFIDDYITIREPIVDYLTQYSGISPGDLDPKTSTHSLVPLKVAYKKLWVLLNLGCKFLGHGLKTDLRVINIQVPRAQIIDTIDLLYVEQHRRKLSLAFLAWHVLKEDVQVKAHDSIEDARTALKLYKKYLEYVDAGILDQMLEEIFRTGRMYKFKPPGRGPHRTATPPASMDPTVTGGFGGGPAGDGGDTPFRPGSGGYFPS